MDLFEFFKEISTNVLLSHKTLWAAILSRISAVFLMLGALLVCGHAYGIISNYADWIELVLFGGGLFLWIGAIVCAIFRL